MGFGDTSLGEAILDLGADSSKLKSDMNSARSGALGVLRNMATVAGGIISAGLITKGIGAIVNFGKSAVLSAGDAAETMSKFEQSFGDASSGAQKSLEEFGAAIGRNKFELIEMAANQGAVLKSLGLGEKAAADYSTSLSKLAVDVGSFNNAQATDVQNAFTKAMTGEFESLKSYGIVLNQTILQEKLREMGVKGNINAVDQATKAEAIYQLLLERTTDAQGDAERTSGSFANQMVALKSKFEETKTMIGMQLLPILTPLIGRFNEFVSTVLPPLLDGFSKLIGYFELVVSDGDLLNDFLVDLIPAWLIDNVRNLIMAVYDLQGSFQESMPMMQEAVANFLTWFQENMQPTIQGIIDNITGILQELAIFWSAHGDEIMGIVSTTFQFILVYVGGVMNLLTGLIKAGLQLINGDTEGATETLKNTWTGFMESVLSLTGTNLDEFRSVWRANGEMLRIIIGTLIVKAINAIKGFYDKFKTAGENLMDGLKNGIIGKAADMVQAVINAVKGAIDAAKSLLQEESPSKVFANIGGNMMLGAENGIQENQNRMIGAVQNAMQAVISTADQAGTNRSVTNQYYLSANYKNQSEVSLINQVRMLSLLEGA